ncbi:MAG: methyltransferase domain-containing protein [Gammaproteobacteria bacterium]|jgi:demethylspheroidene O-methyltransferase|nr:methyltransferase domain-containing protein [Gammaproteobacteria bacterium]
MRALFDLCSGFVYSQVLLACIRLKLLDHLARSPMCAAELAAALDLPRDALDRLLAAAESLRLVERRARDEIGLGSLGAALLGNPAVAMMIEHHSALYADLIDPVALMRGECGTTHLSRYWAYSGNDRPDTLTDEDTGSYSDLMAASQELIAEQVLAAYSLNRHRRLLDVGGGAGAFALAAMRKASHLQACVFDLPSVSARARNRFESHGLSERGSTCGGDFTVDPLPTGFDLVSVVRILHDHNDDVAQGLLQSIRESIAPGGVILVAEPMLGTRGAEPVGAAYFGFYLMAMGQGRPRSPGEIAAMLRTAGFSSVSLRRTPAPLLARVLIAKAET